MKKSSSLHRFLINIYGYTFFDKLLLLTPVYAIFMQQHGITDMQLSLLFILLSVGTFTGQIPVTWLMNKIGPKYAMIIGQILKGIGFIIWLFWPVFIGFAIGMFLWGVMYAIYNVALEGMIYDELRARRNHKIYAKVLGVQRNISSAATALSAFGSLLMFAGYNWITYVSLVMLAISVIFIWRIETNAYPRGRKQNIRKIRFITVFKTGARICRVTPCIFLMMVLTVLVECMAYLDNYLSPIGYEIGLPVEFVGIIQFFILGCVILGQTFAYRFARVKDWIIYSTICVGGVLFVLFSVFYSVSGLWLLGGAYVLFSAVSILLYARFQDFLPSSYRSVILSIYSIANNIIYIVVCMLIGLGGLLGGWRYSVLILGMGLIYIGAWALLFVGDKCAVNAAPNDRRIKNIARAANNAS